MLDKVASSLLANCVDDVSGPCTKHSNMALSAKMDVLGAGLTGLRTLTEHLNESVGNMSTTLDAVSMKADAIKVELTALTETQIPALDCKITKTKDDLTVMITKTIRDAIANLTGDFSVDAQVLVGYGLCMAVAARSGQTNNIVGFGLWSILAMMTWNGLGFHVRLLVITVLTVATFVVDRKQRSSHGNVNTQETMRNIEDAMIAHPEQFAAIFSAVFYKCSKTPGSSVSRAVGMAEQAMRMHDVRVVDEPDEFTKFVKYLDRSHQTRSVTALLKQATQFARRS
jgi:hypothetical protein